ncbi:MAG: hypothetical protein KKG99_12195 [Bacteroidetes bacterium]|nr:hypothetical protein [Bacteroidota bacterium]
MKKNVSAIVLVNFLVLYGLSLSLFDSQIIGSDNSSAKNQPCENESYYAINPLDTLRHCIKTENLVDGFNNLPVTALKKHFNAFSTKIKTAELFHINEFAKYISYTKNAVIDFEQSDIIYPFHFFL